MAGKIVILVDDGAATGATMKVAIRAIKRRSPREIIVALPVAPADTAAELAREAHTVICLSKPARFFALGYHYHDFPQISEEEVISLLNSHATDKPASANQPKRLS